ncbi:hypothetical protein JCGZ_24335 [Jatropha curcas]|uniref:Uncharacterized protein n=1 Tax=Jatropha curcas TaxID=180498 RepID=A0A067L259_JATCU|nr:hypothetical protein JCGZ_24335 [Jatropha curcas]
MRENKEVEEALDWNVDSYEISDDESDEGDSDDDDPECPMIRVPQMKKKVLQSKWKSTLIIKVLGRSFGFAFLQKKLKTIWNM